MWKVRPDNFLLTFICVLWQHEFVLYTQRDSHTDKDRERQKQGERLTETAHTHTQRDRESMRGKGERERETSLVLLILEPLQTAHYLLSLRL